MAIEAALLVGAAGLAQAKAIGNIADAQTQQSDINIEQIEASNKIDQDIERRRSVARRGALEGKIGSSGFTRSGSALSIIADELFTSQLNEALVLSRGGQSVTRQQNIRNTTKARGSADVTGTRINAVTSGITVGNTFGQLLR